MTDLILYFLFIFSFLFSAFLFWCFWSWKKSVKEIVSSKANPEPVSLIVSARNEESTIRTFLNAIMDQDYPRHLLELIIVDDHSEDRTAGIINEFILHHPEMDIRLIQLKGDEEGSKKTAITLAVKAAKAGFILSTDADCVPSTSWISCMVAVFLEKNALFLAGPVDIKPGPGIFGKIQSLEFMGLVGITAAGIGERRPIMCNGANMMFTKTIFQDVGGFDAVRSFASGDDTQLLLKISKESPEKVFFIKEEGAIVSTQSAQSWNDFIEQRKRWAGKIPFALTSFTISIAVIAWFTHALLLLSLFLSLYLQKLPGLFLLSFSIIAICEFLLLNSLAGFFHRRTLLWLFLPLQFFYWIYIVLIGVIAPFGTFRWKNRITH